jgi:hypothetical protein
MEPIKPRVSIPQIIRSAAERHGIPPQIALAFAWLESKHDPRLEGDLGWADRSGGDLYKRRVRDVPMFKSNPARDDREAWHSYGLFQLLAPYHTLAHEHPRVLLDPEINADRGCKAIARLLVKTDGDVLSARYAYTGAGYSGQLVSEDHRTLIATRLRDALERFKEG